MSSFNLLVLVIAALALYIGLGVMFYTPETGFSWLLWFVGGTLLVFVIIGYLARRDLMKLAAEREDNND